MNKDMKFDIDMVLQTVISSYPGSKIYTQFDIDWNKFVVLIEYLGQVIRLKFDISEIEHRAGIARVISTVTDALEKTKLGEEQRTDSPSDNTFKCLFDICKTYDVSINIRRMAINRNICCVRVLKDGHSKYYMLDLDETARVKIPTDEAIITRLDMAAKELSNNIYGFDVGSVNKLAIKEDKNDE